MKISLKKLIEHYKNNEFSSDSYKLLVFEESDLIDLCMDLSKQVLKLAAENAEIINDPNSYCGNTGSEYPPDEIVSKQSILDTIKQIN